MQLVNLCHVPADTDHDFIAGEASMPDLIDTVNGVLKRIGGFTAHRIGPDVWLKRVSGDPAERVDGLYRRRSAEELRIVLEQNAIDLVLDVGANLGQFGSQLRQSSKYRGRIVSFEPVRHVYEQLRSRAAADPLWEAHCMALGSRNATAEINVSSESDFTSFLPLERYATEQFNNHPSTAGTEMVEVRRLEDVLGEVAPGWEDARIFLKLDTQGYDLEVFAGLGSAVGSMRILLSELSLIPVYAGMPHLTESIARYEEAGFGIVGMYPVSREASTRCVIEFDCLMVRRH